MMEIGEYRAFRAYRPAAWLKVTGEDAATYLQGQFSQDLRGLRPGDSTYGLLLNHKGRIQADAFIVKTAPDTFWLGSYECRADALRARLESFIVADDVIVEDQTENYSAFSVMLEEDSAASPRPLAPYSAGDLPTAPTPQPAPVVPFASEAPAPSATTLNLFNEAAALPKDVLRFKGRRGRSESWEFVFPRGSTAESKLANALLATAREQPPEFWERARILAGIPSIPRDAGPGDLPQEVGLVAPAVSFTKGCYLGQEIMARLKTRGRVRRQLRLVRFPSLPSLDPEPAHLRPHSPIGPIPLYDGLRPLGGMGELRSWTPDTNADCPAGGFIGLAMLPADAPPGAKYSFQAGGEAVILA